MFLLLRPLQKGRITLAFDKSRYLWKFLFNIEFFIFHPLYLNVFTSELLKLMTHLSFSRSQPVSF